MAHSKRIIISLNQTTQEVLDYLSKKEMQENLSELIRSIIIREFQRQSKASSVAEVTRKPGRPRTTPENLTEEDFPEDEREGYPPTIPDPQFPGKLVNKFELAKREVIAKLTGKQ